MQLIQNIEQVQTLMPSVDVITRIINVHFSEPHASLLNGILLGVELQTSEKFYTAIKRAGLLHIVVLSGINITLLGNFVYATTRFLHKKLSAAITIVCIIAFVLFVGVDPPITRAAVMGVLSLTAMIFNRRQLTLYAFFLSVVIMLIINIEWLTSVSFQLSSGATLGIILWGHSPHRSPKTMFSHVLYVLEQELRPTFAAQLFTTPIIFYYFREISLIAPLANVLIGWITAPIMVLGLFSRCTVFSQILAVPIKVIVYFMIEYVVRMMYVLGNIKYGFISFAS